MINSLPKSLIEAAKEILSKDQSEENFKKWFGKSILKHEDGSPMHFYHGTNADFSKYGYAHVGKGTDQYGAGFYFTNKPDVADMYASKGEGHPNVHRVHLKVENPIYAETDDETPLKRTHIKNLIINAPDHKESLMNFGDVNYSGYNKVLNDTIDSYAELPKLHAMHAIGNDFYRDDAGKYLENFKKHTGHDAVIAKNEDTGHVVVNVFHPSQIKSSIGNIGTYDPKSHEITEAVSIEQEPELHVQNRKSLTPIEHVRNIVGEHQKLGWNLAEDESILHKPLTKSGIGCTRTVLMKHDNGRTALLKIRFKSTPTTKQNEYKIQREIRNG